MAIVWHPFISRPSWDIKVRTILWTATIIKLHLLEEASPQKTKYFYMLIWGHSSIIAIIASPASIPFSLSHVMYLIAGPGDMERSLAMPKVLID